MRRVLNPVPVLLLQHPQELRQVKNTSGLLHRCLAHVRVEVGERLQAPASTDGMALLYPSTAADPDLPSPRAWPPPGGVQTLVVIDATWRKSRRMLHLNPWLAALPRLSLVATPPSRYAIRRVRGDDQRSTLEACALALAQLEGDDSRYLPLWEAMDAFVTLQQRLLREGRAGRDAGESTSG